MNSALPSAQLEHNSSTPLSSSFRDRAGFVFVSAGKLYRQVNKSYAQQFEHLHTSGLFKKLTELHLIVPHSEVERAPVTHDAYKIIQPELIPFVSYPSEWCFGQLKAAALTTLSVQRTALEYGMTLKDASAFNIQFKGALPLFIDTLSFEIYREGQPWVAYRQFCQHFLAPLALMAFADARLNRLLQVFIDGVPLEIASSLLPLRTYLSPRILFHIHLHARSQKKYADAARSQDLAKAKSARVSKAALLGLIESLKATVEGLEWNPAGTEWGDYYSDTNYSSEAMTHKRSLVESWVKTLNPSSVWDMGANTGEFSRLAAQNGRTVIAFDIDPAAVEKNFRQESRDPQQITPLVLDLTCPTPNFGWALEERQSITQRGPADVVLALALVHHLAIGNNVPLTRVAQFFANCGRSLIIEFVPKSDSQVSRLLASREDIFHDYTKAGFEAAFEHFFIIKRCEAICGSERWLYMLECKKS